MTRKLGWPHFWALVVLGFCAYGIVMVLPAMMNKLEEMESLPDYESLSDPVPSWWVLEAEAKSVNYASIEIKAYFDTRSKRRYMFQRWGAYNITLIEIPYTVSEADLFDSLNRLPRQME